MSTRPPGPTKRQKELHRLEKRKEKDARREQRKREKDDRATTGVPGEDPDLAGIIPGPQPRPEAFGDEPVPTTPEQQGEQSR